jgi:hypothetical protein
MDASVSPDQVLDASDGDQNRVSTEAAVAIGFDPPHEDGAPGAAVTAGKKKPRKPKKKKPSASPASDGEAPTASQPGKKTLRKLRYQQANVSPREHLWFSAQKLASTGHARILHHNQNVESVDEITGCPDTLRVVTATNWSAPAVERILAALPVEGARDAGQTVVAAILVRPLVVLDLNGILCHRIRSNRPPKRRARAQQHREDYRESVTTVAGTPVIPRSDLAPFLRMLTDAFCVAIWTSAKAKTAKSMLRALIPPDLAARLLFVYSQHHCRAIIPADSERKAEGASTPASSSTAGETTRVGGYVKPLFEKDLGLVWKEFPLWNANNTLLYDDSPEKCAQWQSNAAHPPSITGTSLDDARQEQHLEFMRSLAAHWESEPGWQHWDAEAGDPVFVRFARQAEWLHEQARRLGWDQQPEEDQ